MFYKILNISLNPISTVGGAMWPTLLQMPSKLRKSKKLKKQHTATNVFETQIIEKKIKNALQQMPSKLSSSKKKSKND